jgi:hypothetical protein
MENLERRIIRYKLMDKHRELVRGGELETAHCIFRLLRRGSVRLGLRDPEWAAEMILESVGLRGHCGRGGYSSTFYLKKED